MTLGNYTKWCGDNAVEVHRHPIDKKKKVETQHGNREQHGTVVTSGFSGNRSVFDDV